MSQTTVTHLPSCFAGFPGAVLHLSPVGRVVESNGHLERELGTVIIGEPFSQIIDAESCGEKWGRTFATTRATGTPATCELVLANGETMLEPKPFSVLWDAESSVVWLIEHPSDRRMENVRQQVTEVNSELASAQRDLIRERERLAQALADTERSNRALDEFAHAISHDLKAPLRSVANYARWIEEDLGDQLTGEPRAHMELLRTQVERMRTMISAVLEYARSGRTRLPPEVVNTKAIVEEVIALLDPPDSVTIDVAPDMPTFTAEAAPLRQVLLNLIGNAIKHSRHPDTHVWVTVRDIGYAYEFAVRDNGPGIPPRAQEKIWTLFHTLRPRTTQDGADDGTGVGLAIVRQLVGLQGGTTWVESDEGKGATFHFLWPKQTESRGGDGDAPAGMALDV
jgi:signal transduction histidine kinase